MATDVVDLSYNTFGDNLVKRASMTFDIEPVSHLLALAIDRQLIAFQHIENNQWNQLLWEVIRAVVI